MDNGDELVSRVTSDASAPASLFTVAVSFVTSIVAVVKAFIQLYETNVTLANYSLLIIPMTLVVCIVYGKLMFRLGVYGTVTMAGSLGYLAERVRNFRLIKSAACERMESHKGDKTFKEMYKADFLSWLMVAGYQLMSGIFSIFFIVIAFVIGGQLIPSGKLTIGDLTAFYMVTGIATMKLMQLFMDVGSVTGTFGSMQKISTVCESLCEPTGGNPVQHSPEDLVFDNVSFGYSEDKPVLKNVNLTVPKGKVTAIIGGNGAGKSTLFKLITRLYEPQSGEIRFGTTPISTFNLTDWRNEFAFVFQKYPLIGGTVRENITYGIKREIDDNELADVAKNANCYDCIMQKPDGFDEDVGPSGSAFSGGQSQCISIARAMLKNADYLLLDEATSNLDALSEAQVTGALDALMTDKTTVMIAHNYAATRHADYIVVMNNGTVEDAGTPDELKSRNEYYKLFCKTV